ncbi:DUF962 domain-containing protein [Shewanella algae]|uniref:Mpo1 family 2-hydroxy fatty acid dioxygenase n=1 Tax=Shewanella algae TaxID=38313 RepID=UPI0012DD4E63|nr:Mpo1-like protein [Shewanella algae]QGS59174.1 DUF962 domain-containing protein [Shewanella algae]
MKSAVEQLSTYKSVHLNPTNIKTHFIGIPLIIWSVFLMLSLWRLPFSSGTLSVAMLLAVGVMLYYIKLHWRLALGLALFILPMILTTEWLYTLGYASIWLGITVFVIGWIFQFIGHKYEKAKPAFIDDLNQLLIGPFFLMAEVFFMLGLEGELDNTITAIARDKRRALEAARRADNTAQ